MKKTTLILSLSAFFAAHTFAFGLSDIADNIDRADSKCKSGDQSCKNREHLKAAARVAAIAVTVKVIADMVVDFRSSKITDEEKVTEDYLKTNKKLAATPIAAAYSTQTLPGKVIQPGNKVTILSDIIVVPGSEQREALIEERITIFDNEDNSKALRNLTKAVNAETRRGGHFQNEFSFTPPQGLPQGVYPIKTELLLDGVATKTASSDIQLVMQINEFGTAQMLASGK